LVGINQHFGNTMILGLLFEVVYATLMMPLWAGNGFWAWYRVAFILIVIRELFVFGIGDYGYWSV
jgi:hypothetical protein